MNLTLQRLGSCFTEERVGYIVAALGRAYAENVSRYQPSLGDDGMNFGLNVYKAKVHFVALLAEHFSWIKVVQRAPFFRFQIEDYFLSTYCAGHVDGIVPMEAFPANRNRAGRLAEVNAQQASFWTAEEWERTVHSRRDDSGCRELILNDVGNPVDGLLKVFLGVPIDRSEDGSVSGWSTVYELWDHGSTALSLPALPFGAEVEPETVTKFQPTLKETPKVASNEE